MGFSLPCLYSLETICHCNSFIALASLPWPAACYWPSPLHAADASASASSSANAAASNATASESAPAANTLRIHYKRSNGDQAEWGVYAWEGPEVPSKKWIADRFMFTGKDSYGGFVDIPIAKGKIEIRFLVTNAQGYKKLQHRPKPSNQSQYCYGWPRYVGLASLVRNSQ